MLHCRRERTEQERQHGDPRVHGPFCRASVHCVIIALRLFS
jgi:hypothetical protein